MMRGIYLSNAIRYGEKFVFFVHNFILINSTVVYYIIFQYFTSITLNYALWIIVINVVLQKFIQPKMHLLN